MNATLTTGRRHESTVHHERSALELPSPQVRRVGLVDRAALHLGVALIKWGRRPAVAPGRERRATRMERAYVRDRQNALASLASEGTTLDYVSRLAPLR